MRLRAARRSSTRAWAAVREHPAAADGALAVILAAAAVVSVVSLYGEFSRADPTFPRPGDLAIVASMVAITLPLAWRRRFPLVVAVAVVAAFLVARLVVDVQEQSMTVLATSLALYSAAAHGRSRVRTPVVALCLGAVLAEVARELFFATPNNTLRPLTQSFFFAYNVVVLSLPWLLGATIRESRERERDLAERADELRRERTENAREAVFAERVRIARELHDVVAHHVSVMGVQAGAARRVMAHRPEKAVEALSSIEASSRQAVLELQRLLGFLRRAGEADDDLAPQPRLAELGDLATEAARGDLAVALSVEGSPRPLPPTLELSAYRVVQEALTNARKHSRGRTATVRLRYTPSALEINVIDDGVGTVDPAVGAPAGHGLIGMRERAALHGGHVRAGPECGGGFAVRATFPLDGHPS